MKRHLLLLGLSSLFWLAPSPAHSAEEFLDPELAFKVSVSAADAQRIEIRFDVAPGYYLYGDKFNVAAEPGTVALGALQVPKGKIKFDETFQKDVESHRDSVALTLPLKSADGQPFKLLVGNQGCADKGLCYPPMQRAFRADAEAGGGFRFSLLSEAQAAAWTPAAATTASTGQRATTAPTPAPTSARAAGVSESGQFTAALQGRNLLNVAGVFVLAGLLLSFTPCVLPMVPILSSIIVGQGGGTSKAKGFGLAASYSLGMALVYTAFGMAAGLAGEGLAAALQNAWVLGGFALLLVALSLSMFGLYELQMPSSVQGRLNQWSGRLRGGQHIGVFLMGGLSALIVGPCVAAPLAGALVYISQSRDVVLGGVALFAMAAGMSVPLLLVGLSAGSVLPRAGAWMVRVKHFFGVALLAVALWLVSPVLPNWALMLGVAALLLGSAVYLGAFERLAEAVTPARAVTKGLGLMMAVLATLQLAGVASGGRDVLQPLQHLALGAGGHAGGASASKDELKFVAVANLAAVEAAVASSSRPVMLDFYADWCVACKELETLTFTDEGVRRRLGAMTLLRIDVTANNADDKAVMRKFGLFGPPALLFFNPAGGELSEARVIGFQNAKVFSAHLDQIEALSSVRLSLK